jgi:hypothetical protein
MTTSVDSGDTKEYSVVVYESGSDIYICKAALGAALTSAVWQIKKVNTTSGVVVQWCDGDDDFDNLATSLSVVAALSYS